MLITFDMGLGYYFIEESQTLYFSFPDSFLDFIKMKTRFELYKNNNTSHAPIEKDIQNDPRKPKFILQCPC